MLVEYVMEIYRHAPVVYERITDSGYFLEICSIAHPKEALGKYVCRVGMVTWGSLIGPGIRDRLPKSDPVLEVP